MSGTSEVGKLQAAELDVSLTLAAQEEEIVYGQLRSILFCVSFII